MIVRVVLSAALLLGAVGTARAGFIVSVGNATVAPGGGAFVDVTITGDTGNTQLLDYFIAVFRITPVGPATPGAVWFSTVQDSSYAMQPSYVFTGNSASLTQSVSTVVTPNDTLTVGDFTLDNAGMDVSAGKLLTRLKIEADSSVLANTNYRIDLIHDESQFQNQYFEDVSFQSNSGQVATVAPEPVSLALLGIAVPGLAMMAWRKARMKSSCARG